MHTMNRQDLMQDEKLMVKIGQVRTVACLDQTGSGYFMFKKKQT